MHAKSLVMTALAAALFAGLFALPAAAEDTPGPPAGESSDRAPTGTAEPPSVTVLNTHEVEGILGRQVLGADDENMGRIVDVIVDRSGRVPAARSAKCQNLARSYPRSGQGGARISGGQTHRRFGCARQARATAV